MKPKTKARRKSLLPPAVPGASRGHKGAAATGGGLRVELAPDVTVWSSGSRADVILRGRVFAGTPPRTVAILDTAGVELASAGFDAASGGETGAHGAGFQVCLPMAAATEPIVADLWVRAEAQDGAVCQEAFRLGRSRERAAILAGPAGAPDPDDRPGPWGLLFPELAAFDPGGWLRVGGWVVSRTPVAAVRVLVDGIEAGVARHGLERPDVAAAWPGFPESSRAGFSLNVPVPAGLTAASRVTIEATGGSGWRLAVSLTLDGSAATAPTRDQIVMGSEQCVLDRDGRLRLTGWAWCVAGVTRIAVSAAGTYLGDASHGLARPDLTAGQPGLPEAIGFAFDHSWDDQAADVSEITVTAIDPQGQERTLRVPVIREFPPTFRFELDNPPTRDGVAIHPVAGRLLIEGWALARDGIAGIDVTLDGEPVGQAHYGTARPDVALALPEWEGAVRSGYLFHCPPRVLTKGEHVIALTARSRAGQAHVHAFRVTVDEPDDFEAAVSIRKKINRAEQIALEAVLARLNHRPAIHLVVAGGPADEAAYARTIRSILEQSWRAVCVLFVIAGARDAGVVRSAIRALAGHRAGDFVVIRSTEVAWPAPFRVGKSHALLGFLAPGDVLGRDALGAFAMASGLDPAADCFYADEVLSPPGGARPEAFFKPDYSPALLLSSGYAGRPLIVSPPVLTRSGVTPASLMEGGFHDLALRCTEVAARVHHVRDLLSRTDQGVAPRGGGARVVADAMARRGIPGTVAPGLTAGTWRPRPAGVPAGKVSIIIPTRAAEGCVATCLASLRDRTAWPDYEIVIIDNIPPTDRKSKRLVRQHADRVLEIPPPFNWSRFNNAAAAASDGEYLLFLNDDIEIEDPHWLTAMLEEFAWPDVGIVGARLLYPTRTVQHAGMFLGHGVGRHAFRHAAETDPGYFGLALTRREVIAVTGACMLVRRETFEQLGRFDEAHDIVNNDLDFCLRAHRAGLRTIVTPHATLIHHEQMSRAGLGDKFDSSRFDAAWRTMFATGDPYFNPGLSRDSDDHVIDDEPLRAVHAAYPVIDRETVRAILAVKLDHIGDFITALPAIRRLKAIFPLARLTALVAPASAVLAAAEPAIDEAIPFEFFHARSELGERDLTRDDLDALTARLAPYRFDLAVDLRKHLSTRPILLCAGARASAGYDAMDAYPWLDIVLEWEGDQALRRKRSNIADDLLKLVAAIEVACAPGRAPAALQPRPMPRAEMPNAVKGLFVRPVVAMHPGSGNVMKRLPAKLLSGVIDLLIERNDVSVLLVGGADDADLAAALVRDAAHPERVASVAGAVALGDLPRLLAACALFVGSDSGPKHIAAAAGIPVVGVHSGVVDPAEWGPIGPMAVALHRDMRCAPCFLSKADDCPRGLACIEGIEPAQVHAMAERFLARPVLTSAPSRRREAVTRKGTAHDGQGPARTGRAPRGRGGRDDPGDPGARLRRHPKA